MPQDQIAGLPEGLPAEPSAILLATILAYSIVILFRFMLDRQRRKDDEASRDSMRELLTKLHDQHTTLEAHVDHSAEAHKTIQAELRNVQRCVDWLKARWPDNRPGWPPG